MLYVETYRKLCRFEVFEVGKTCQLKTICLFCSGDSIICWSPNNFNSQWVAYSDAFCWVSNTFYAPLNTHHDPTLDRYDAAVKKYKHFELQYYQWVPLILFLQVSTHTCHACSFQFKYEIFKQTNSLTNTLVCFMQRILPHISCIFINRSISFPVYATKYLVMNHTLNGTEDQNVDIFSSVLIRKPGQKAGNFEKGYKITHFLVVFST